MWRGAQISTAHIKKSLKSLLVAEYAIGSFYCKLILKPMLIATTNGKFCSHMPEMERETVVSFKCVRD